MKTVEVYSAGNKINVFVNSDPQAQDATGHVYGEVPVGSINGINKNFMLEHTPLAGKHSLYLNGVKLNKSTYTIDGNALQTAEAPLTGDELAIDYDYKL